MATILDKLWRTLAWDWSEDGWLPLLLLCFISNSSENDIHIIMSKTLFNFITCWLFGALFVRAKPLGCQKTHKLLDINQLNESQESYNQSFAEAGKNTALHAQSARYIFIKKLSVSW